MELPGEVKRILRDQNGVIASRQAIACGLTKSDLDRLVRRRMWVRLLPGVYLDHTGEATWLQRAWAGVLYYAPAALAGPSAVNATAGSAFCVLDESGPVWVAVAASRNVTSRPGYRIRYLSAYDAQVLDHLHPPRMRFEEACLDLVAATRSELARIHILARACQSRRTTATKLLGALAQRRRMPERLWVASVLHDIADGSCSVLEHGYVTKVERRHGLPRGRRQRPDDGPGGRVYRDVAYEQFDQLLELDSVLFHNSPGSRDADLERDLDAAVSSQGTIRLGWGQIFGRPCRTAAKVGALLASRGWTGTVHPCGPDCEASEVRQD